MTHGPSDATGANPARPLRIGWKEYLDLLCQGVTFVADSGVSEQAPGLAEEVLSDLGLRGSVECYESAETPEAGERVFPDMGQHAILKALQKVEPGVTAHGFRSTFRDWVAERTNFSSEVAEMALAHAVGDKVEAAYRRGDINVDQPVEIVMDR